MLRSFVAAVVLGLASVGAQASPVSGQGTWETTLQARDADPNTPDIEAYYDTVLNITWLADANYAQTSGFDLDGLMYPWEAEGWTASLNRANYLGVTNWRLPMATDTGGPGCQSYAYTGNECGWNVDLTTGEMAHLFYSTLGNSASYDTGGGPTGCSPYSCLTNDGPFLNLQPTVYWYGTPYFSPTEGGWMFRFNDGLQSGGTFGSAPAWAVASGDPLATPIPAADWLLGSALGLMGVMRRKTATCQVEVLRLPGGLLPSGSSTPRSA